MTQPVKAMLNLTDRMTGLKQLSFLLPGFSFLYPSFAFPTALALLNSPFATVAAVFIGLLIYAIPAHWVDWILENITWRFRRNSVSPRKYMKRIEYLIHPNSANNLPRMQAYSIYYTAYIPQRIKEKIEWLLSLYYFYSRVSLVALVHFFIFVVPVVYLGIFLWQPNLYTWTLIIVPGESPESLFLKPVGFLTLSLVLAVLLYFPARRALQRALDSESAAVTFYGREIDQLSSDYETASQKKSDLRV